MLSQEEAKKIALAQLGALKTAGEAFIAARNVATDFAKSNTPEDVQLVKAVALEMFDTNEVVRGAFDAQAEIFVDLIPIQDALIGYHLTNQILKRKSASA